MKNEKTLSIELTREEIEALEVIIDFMYVDDTFKQIENGRWRFAIEDLKFKINALERMSNVKPLSILGLTLQRDTIQ